MVSSVSKLILTSVVGWSGWRILQWCFSKSSLDNIPGPPSVSFWKGNWSQLFHPHAWGFHREISEKYGRVVKLNAFMGTKVLYITDTTALHHILVKDHHVYEETTVFMEGNRLTFGDGNIFSKTGEQHRKQRKIFNPIFATPHIRKMVPIFYSVVNKLQATIASKVADGPQDLDMLLWTSRTALELIGQAGLGHSFDPLTSESVSNPYITSVKQLMPALARTTVTRTLILPWASKIGTARFRRSIIDIVPSNDVRLFRDASDMMRKTSTDIFEMKKRALEAGDEAVLEQVGQGNDIISILMRANTEASGEDRMSDAEVISQASASALIFAATDSTSAAMSRVLLMLADHPDVQDKLREEIVTAWEKHGRDLTYDEVMSFPYLDAVCRETLRLYPPVSTLLRTSREDNILPLSRPIKGVDGTDIHEILVPNNTTIIVSILNTNCKPEIWGPDSYEWKPERWLSPLPDTVIDANIPGVYSNLMTFLAGARGCLGFKFAQLEMKIVLSILLKSFKFAPSGKEIAWHMNTIVVPVVPGSLDGRPQMPLKVSLVR